MLAEEVFEWFVFVWGAGLSSAESAASVSFLSWHGFVFCWLYIFLANTKLNVWVRIYGVIFVAVE